MSEEKSSANSGCFGCLLEIVGILGLIYICTHWGSIWQFIK
jgi:hypothetical protein